MTTIKLYENKYYQNCDRWWGKFTKIRQSIIGDESCYDLARENKELKEKIQTLELRLDNKEKLNEEYRKQLDGYKM